MSIFAKVKKIIGCKINTANLLNNSKFKSHNLLLLKIPRLQLL